MRPSRRDLLLLGMLIVLGTAGVSRAQTATAKQPKVAPGPNEPDWEVILKEGPIYPTFAQYGPVE